MRSTDSNAVDQQEMDQFQRHENIKDMSTTEAKRKRNRMVISCTSCRRKKIKCNRQKPICSSCKARNYTLDQCVYSEAPEKPSKKTKRNKWLANTELPKPLNDGIGIKNERITSIPEEALDIETLRQELASINERKLLLDDLAKSMDATHGENTEYLTLKMELLEKENNVLSALTSFYVELPLSNSGSVNTVVVKEISKSCLFQTINVSSIYAIRFKPNRTIYFGPTCFRSAVAFNPHFYQIYQFVSKLTTRDRKRFKNEHRNLDFACYFPFNIDRYYDYNIAQNDSGTLTPMPPEIKPLNLFPNPANIKNEQDLLTSLVNILPRYSELMFHVEQFFDNLLDHFYPFVTRSYILAIVNEIIIPKTDAEKAIVGDPNKNDFKILLISRYRDCSRVALILSLIKISLLYTDNPFNSINPLVPNKEPSKVESLLLFFSMKFLSLLKLMKRPLISSLQTLLFLKTDKMYHLNEGEGGDSSDGHLLHSLAFTMAIMCGLGRDIEKNFKDSSPEYRKMLKNTWKYLTLLDWRQSFDLGYPLHIDDLQFSETTSRHVLDSYQSKVDVFEINRQFKLLHDIASEGGDFNKVMYDYCIPIMRNLNFQLNSLHGENLTLFKLEIYVQNLIKFYCNRNFFNPLFESLANPIVQNSQLPKNVYNFVQFIKKIKLQMAIIDVIFTLYNLMFMILQRFDKSIVQDPNIPKLINFYGNQAVNFVIFILKSTKKFLDIRAKDKFFQIYIFENVKKVIHRSSNFIYSNLLFSYNSNRAEAQQDTGYNMDDFKNSFQYYFNENRNFVKNIRLNSSDEFLNNTLVTSFSDEEFDRICFANNQYDLVYNGDINQQYNNFHNFVKNEYVYYNFYNKKVELSNLIFEFFFKNVKENLKNYYVFYVAYKLSMHFYSYLKDRDFKNVVSLHQDNSEPNSNKNNTDNSGKHAESTVTFLQNNVTNQENIPLSRLGPDIQLNIPSESSLIPMLYQEPKYGFSAQYNGYNMPCSDPIVTNQMPIQQPPNAEQSMNVEEGNYLLFSNPNGSTTTTTSFIPSQSNNSGVSMPNYRGPNSQYNGLYNDNGLSVKKDIQTAIPGDATPSIGRSQAGSSKFSLPQPLMPMMTNLTSVPWNYWNYSSGAQNNTNEQYNPINLLTDDFYIDVDDLFNQINASK